MSTTTPLISVIIPIYNVEEYIADCLDSVLSQTYQNIEVICVDDCSPDGSIKIVERLVKKESRIKILRHTLNRGVGPARNTGMKAAKGDFISFLDPDDMLYPDALEKLLEIAQNTGADVTAGRVVAFPHVHDEKLEEFAARYNRYDDNAAAGLFRFSGEEESPCLRLSVVVHGRLFCASFLKKEELRFIDKNVVHQDNGFFYKYMSCRPLVAITDILAIRYRIRPNSAMTALDAQSHEKRKLQHLTLVCADSCAYIKSKYEKKTAEKILRLLNLPIQPSPFIFDYGRLFQLKWVEEEKLIRILGLPIFKKRLTSTNKLEYSVFSIRLCRDNRNKSH